VGLGFQLSESLSGSYYRLDEPLRDRAMSLSLSLRVDGLRRFVRERRVLAEGTIIAEGLAEGGKPVSGTIAWKLFDEKRVPYDLAFEGDDGRVYRLRGQRDFFVYDALDSLTILATSLYDEDDREIGRATLRFDAKSQLPELVKSFRPRVRLLSRR
jgi:hypothetical protein